MSQPLLELESFQNFIDALPDATLLVDPQHKIAFSNSQVLSVFGYAVAELVGLDIDVLLPDRFRVAHAQYRQSYMAEPKVRAMGSGASLWALHKDGREFPVEVSLSPIQTNLGLMIVCSVRDITHLKNAEQAFINDERFKLFMAHAPSAIAMFDKDMRYLAVSQRWLLDYRLEMREVIGLSHYQVFPEIPERWRDIHRRCLAGEVQCADEDTFVRANGHTDWVKWEMCPWYGNDGSVGGLILFTEVITARKDAEHRLRTSEGHFRKILDNAVTGVAITDLAGHFQYCNSAYCAITGYSLSKLQRMHFQDLIHPEDVEANLAKVQQLIDGEIAFFVTENRYLSKAGQTVWVRKYGSTLPGDPISLMMIVIDVTDLKRIELDLQQSYRKLAASESLFRSLIESMPQMAWISNADGQIRYANSQWLAYLNNPESAESSGEWFAPVHPSERQRVILAWKRAVEQLEAFNIECRLLSSKNSYRWWQIRGVILRQEPDETVDWLGICTDIQDLKHEEEALERLNEACLRLWQITNLENGLQEMLAATMTLLQTDMGIIQLLRADGNLEIVAQQGFRQDFLDCFRSVSAETPAPCGWALRTGQRQMIADINLTPYAFREIARQAGYRAVQSTPLLFRDGQPIGVISNYFRKPRFLDALEASMLEIYAQQAANFIKRCQAETQLRLSEQHFRSVFDNSLAGIAISDKNGAILDCNGAFAALLGYSHEELMQRPLEQLMFLDDANEHKRQFQQLLEWKVPFFQIETRYLCKSGALLWVNKYVSILHKQNVGEETVLTVISDITPLKLSQAELRDNKTHLEAAVKSRTQELDVARIAAEKANAFKTRFLNAASHDLRQPLQSASLYLSVLATQLKSSDSESICAALNESLSMMENILDALLDISRLESGSILPCKRDFSVTTLFDRVAANTIPLAVAKGLTIEYRQCNCILHTDQVLLERILGNLVDNAIKYTQKGTITVSCDCGNMMSRLSVADTGIGIPLRKLPHIFEAYYQINGSESLGDKNLGLGLGLAIVKYIADVLGLKLAVASTLAKGSVFSVDVPLGSSLQLGSIEKPLEPTAKPIGANKVLFIDDDEGIRKAIKILLEAHAISGHFSESGEAALAAIDDGLRPGVIISDFQLPGLDGIETVSRIRAATGTEIPALIITGNTTLTKSLGIKLGNCTAYSKPIEPDRLLKFIAAHLAPTAG